MALDGQKERRSLQRSVSLLDKMKQVDRLLFYRKISFEEIFLANHDS